MAHLLLAFAALLVLSGTAIAQEEENPQSLWDWYATAPEFQDRLEIHLGSVDITVIDKKTDQPVVGLLPDDFVLLVDGEPREISNFSAYGRGTPPMSFDEDTGVEPTMPEGRQLAVRPNLIVIFIDNENITRPNRNIVLRQLESFAHEYVQPPHKAMVVVNNPGLRRVGRITSDADELMANLEQLVGTTTGATKTRTYARFAESRIRELAPANQQQRMNVVDLEQALSTARMNSAQTDDAVYKMVDTLKTLIRVIGGAPGRKDVIYVSDGVPRSPGREMFLLIDELFRSQEGIQETQERDRMSLYLQLVAYARAADVTVHTIDANGLQIDHGSNADTAWYRTAEFEVMRRENYQAPLFFLADQTGGIAVVNTNKIDIGLADIGGATRTYYSLGFQLEPPLQDRTHNVKIELPNHPKYTLHYRPVFRERTAPTRTAERTMTGLLLDVVDNPVGIVGEVGEIVPTEEKKRWTVPVLIHAPVSALTLLPAGDDMVGRVSTYCVAGSEAGAKSKVQHSSQEIRVPASRINEIATVSFKIEVETETGTDRVSLGVLDETSGAVGFTVVDVALPDKDA